MNNTSPQTNHPATSPNGPEFLSATGDTLYSTLIEGATFYIMAVRCREFGWKVTNHRARFSKAEVAQNLADNRWTQV